MVRMAAVNGQYCFFHGFQGVKKVLHNCPFLGDRWNPVNRLRSVEYQLQQVCFVFQCVFDFTLRKVFLHGLCGLVRWDCPFECGEEGGASLEDQDVRERHSPGVSGPSLLGLQSYWRAILPFGVPSFGWGPLTLVCWGWTRAVDGFDNVQQLISSELVL